MSCEFPRLYPKKGPILVEAEATGPGGGANLKLVLDTGATTSLKNLAALLYLGFDPEQSQQRVRRTTGSSVVDVPIVTPTRLSVLGQHRFGFPVIAHALPASSAVDGLLGLDFQRGQVITIDFRAGRLALSCVGYHQARRTAQGKPRMNPAEQVGCLPSHSASQPTGNGSATPL